MALSVLGHVMNPPRDWTKLQRVTVRELLPGPVGWMPAAWAFQSPVDFPLPSAQALAKGGRVIGPKLFGMRAVGRASREELAVEHAGGQVEQSAAKPDGRAYHDLHPEIHAEACAIFVAEQDFVTAVAGADGSDVRVDSMSVTGVGERAVADADGAGVATR